MLIPLIEIAIQLFAMECFFVMAEFFAALIHTHHGARGFVANSLRSIAQLFLQKYRLSFAKTLSHVTVPAQLSSHDFLYI